MGVTPLEKTVDRGRRSHLEIGDRLSS